MGIAQLKERFSRMKANVVSHARVKYQEYKERRAEEKVEEAKFKAIEKQKFKEAYYRERLKQAAQKGREKGQSSGFLGTISSNLQRNQKQGNMLTTRNIWENDNKNKGVTFGKIKKRII